MGDVGALDIRVRSGIGRWQEDLATAHIAGTDSPLGSAFILIPLRLIIIIIIIIIIINVIIMNNLTTYRTVFVRLTRACEPKIVSCTVPKHGEQKHHIKLPITHQTKMRGPRLTANWNSSESYCFPSRETI
jgi:hypothetical protein